MPACGTKAQPVEGAWRKVLESGDKWHAAG